MSTKLPTHSTPLPPSSLPWIPPKRESITILADHSDETSPTLLPQLQKEKSTSQEGEDFYSDAFFTPLGSK